MVLERLSVTKTIRATRRDCNLKLSLALAQRLAELVALLTDLGKLRLQRRNRPLERQLRYPATEYTCICRLWEPSRQAGMPRHAPYESSQAACSVACGTLHAARCMRHVASGG